MGKARILIAEDEGLVAMSTRTLLEEIGYEVTGIAGTGEDALEQAGRDRPDLVLMDIKLKGSINGVDAARRMKEQLDLQVVFLTGYSDDKTKEQAMDIRPAGFLVKPTGADVLHETIENALKKHD
jgi:DNA-binding NarL/FixJ family response regulator